MESRTLRQWLHERGCRFSEHPHHKGDGVASVTVTCGRHMAELPDSGSRKELAPETVEAIVRQLGLDPAELPRHRDRA